MTGKRPKGSPERVGRLLAGNTHGSVALAARLKDLMIWQSWERAVGETIAGRTRPLRLISGVLTVVVAGGPWMQQLSFMKTELRDRINAVLEEDRVKDIVFKVGKVQCEHVVADTSPPQLKPLSDQQQSWINQQVHSVEDAELRQSLQALMESHYRRQPIG